MRKFVGRSEELQMLEREYCAEAASFVVLYGRRRVGKTTLIEQFMQNKRGIYFLATEESEHMNRSAFKSIVADRLHNKLLASARVDRWEDVFEVIAQVAREMTGGDDKLVLALDEFQYLGKANPAFPSILQRIWDTNLKSTNIMLILCGSLVSMMHSQTLSYDSPLYGRRTAQLRVRQIVFPDYAEFYNSASDRQLVERYSVTGGVPKYVEQFAVGRDIYASISRNLFDSTGFLYDEPNFLLSHEVGEVGTYFSIIRAIAAGNHKLGKIAGMLEVSQTSLSKYLATLGELDLVHREVPVTEKNPSKSKRGRYYIADNFIRFWFRFVLPYVSYIESGHPDVPEANVKSNFIDSHVAYVYEDICRDALWSLSASGRIPFKLDRVGRWWDDKHAKIDVIGIGENDALFGECKFWRKQVGKNVLRELEEKSLFVDVGGKKPHFALFSVAGFTPELVQEASSRDDLLLVKGVLRD